MDRSLDQILEKHEADQLAAGGMRASKSSTGDTMGFEGHLSPPACVYLGIRALGDPGTDIEQAECLRPLLEGSIVCAYACKYVQQLECVCRL